MAPDNDVEKKDELPAEVLTHTTKTIEPVTITSTDTPETAETAGTLQAEASTPEAKPDAEPDMAETPTATTPEATETDLDPEATATAEEAAAVEAKLKRETELESIIESGKYAVPINAVQRKRSHVATLLLCVLAIVLLVALLDVAADVGIVKLPSSVPHTHFFSKH